ncbi:MAG: PDZ domain-containing protein [Flavobacteriaceae bacterium]
MNKVFFILKHFFLIVVLCGQHLFSQDDYQKFYKSIRLEFRASDKNEYTYHREEAAGVFIYSVVKTSPAYEKGLRAGDRIMSIDGELINDLEQCRKLLRQKGKKIKIKAISEDGTKKNVSIRLEPLL